MEGVPRAERREATPVRYRGQRVSYFLHFEVKNILGIYHTSKNMLNTCQ